MENEGIVLERASFGFSQEANCVSIDEDEHLTIEIESSLGIDRDEEGSHFYVLKTEAWSVDGVQDLEVLFNRIKRVIQRGKE